MATITAATRPAAVRSPRGFLCYAHDDWKLVKRFQRLLDPRLKNVLGLETSVWWDQNILVGDPWDETIRAGLAAADFGLILLSPELLVSDYIRRVEIPSLTTAHGARPIPVGLQKVDLDRADLQGLDALQIFRMQDLSSGETRWFADCGGQNPARFCDALAGQIADQLGRPRP